MPFLALNGLEIDVDRSDSVDRDYADAQDFDRSAGTTIEGTHYRELREFGFTIPVQKTSQEIQSQRGWIKGRGHHYTFEYLDGATTRFNRFSTDGGPGFNTNLTATAVTVKFGTWAAKVNSGGTSVANFGFGSEDRYSVSVWRTCSSQSYQLCTVVANGTTTTSYVGTVATTAFPWLTLSAASGSLALTLKGTRVDGSTSATATYDGLMVVPYALTTNQLSARGARTSAEPRFPFVELSGDVLEGTGSIVVKGTVESDMIEQVTERGTVTNMRVAKVKLVER
jgi:hypothetical protein